MWKTKYSLETEFSTHNPETKRWLWQLYDPSIVSVTHVPTYLLMTTGLVFIGSDRSKVTEQELRFRSRQSKTWYQNGSVAESMFGFSQIIIRMCLIKRRHSI